MIAFTLHIRVVETKGQVITVINIYYLTKIYLKPKCIFVVNLKYNIFNSYILKEMHVRSFCILGGCAGI